MILRTAEEYQAMLRDMVISNMLRREYFPPMMADTPWIKTRWPKSQYL